MLLSLITFSFFKASTANEIVASGVLNSCVILLIKSDFISLSFFCFSNALTVRKKAAIMMIVKSTAPIISNVIDCQIKLFACGTIIINNSCGEIPSDILPAGDSNGITCCLLLAESLYSLKKFSDCISSPMIEVGLMANSNGILCRFCLSNALRIISFISSLEYFCVMVGLKNSSCKRSLGKSFSFIFFIGIRLPFSCIKSSAACDVAILIWSLNFCSCDSSAPFIQSI